MKIMVGLDGSNSSKEALSLAKKHAKTFNAKIELVTSMEKGTEAQQKEIEQDEHDLENEKKLLEEDGISCDTHLLIRGMNPGEDLVEFAEKNEVDEIVIGVRRRSKVGKLVFGSTAQYVILNAHCPVVTVK
jgi:nucleotide-binding universal stress UspA family protein